MFRGEATAELATDLVHGRAPHPRVGPREVHELEDAECGSRRVREAERFDPAVVDPHELAWLDVADVRRAHDVEGTRLGCDAEALRQAPDRERPETVRVA